MNNSTKVKPSEVRAGDVVSVASDALDWQKITVSKIEVVKGCHILHNDRPPCAIFVNEEKGQGVFRY